MAEDKKLTQGMPQDELKGAPDGVNSQGKRRARGGSNSGAPNPRQSAKKGAKFAEGLMGHGGQSVMGYHGPQQLGDQEVRSDGNPNAGSKTD